MKKVLALMLAAATTTTVGLTALAEDVSTQADTSSTESTESTASDTSSDESSDASSDVSSDASSDVSSDASSDVSSDASSDVSSDASSDVSSDTSSDVSSDASSDVSSDTSSDVSSSETSSDESSTPVPVGDPTSLVFGADSSTGAILGETLLETGTEYKFPVSVVYADGSRATMPLTEAIMKNYKFSYNRVSGNGVSTMKIEESRGTYYLYIEMKSAAPTKEVDVKYNIRMVKKSNNLSAFTQAVSFTYGYNEANDDYINGLDKGDIIEIDNNNPVITKSQFNNIAKVNDYKNVTLSGPSWQFYVNVTDETTKNMISNNAGIKDVLAALPDQDFKFYNFPGKPKFTATGLVSLDVDDILDDFDKLYTYRYSGGKLYRINATFNAEENTLEFRTNTLDNFLVTNKLIKDGTIVNDSSNSSSTGSNGSNDGNTSDDDKGNPGTGASDMINVAVMAAIAALGAAGTIALKKGSKKK